MGELCVQLSIVAVHQFKQSDELYTQHARTNTYITASTAIDGKLNT